MAIGTTMAALLPAIIATAGGAAKAGMDMMSENKKNKQAKDMALLHTTKEGFAGMDDSFGADMIGNPPKLTLNQRPKMMMR